jgi:hypothetical protein
MTDDPGFYDRALRRLDRIVLALAGAVVVAMAVREGWRGALGAAGGAAFALFSFRTWKKVASAVTGEPVSRPWSALLVRFTIVAATLFVIIRYFGVSAWAVLAGLLVSAAAVVIEIVYELITA